LLDPKKKSVACISESASIRGALESLKASGLGLAAITDNSDKVAGIVTDGDIRKALLDNDSLDQQVIHCMTRDFVYVEEGTAREVVLKLLDEKIRSIPVLNNKRQLVDIVSVGYERKRSKKIVRARAPARVSLAGGGTDFTKYFMDQGGAGLTCTIAKYSHAVLEKRNDSCISIYSHDFKQSVFVDHIDDLQYDGQLDLIKSGIRLLKPDYGFNLEIGCDFPPASGLGGSAALLASLIGVFNEYREHKLDPYAVAEFAFEAERLELGVSGGWQDQYSTVFGGFNYLEFNREHNVVTPLRLGEKILRELEERFILCHTGNSHLGSEIQDQNTTKKTDENEFGKKLKTITDDMKLALLKSDFNRFGELLDETWKLKKENNPSVSNPAIDNIYQLACDAGASAGRLLGTGGGGYLLFFVAPFCRYRVMEVLTDAGLNPEPVLLDNQGMHSWET